MRLDDIAPIVIAEVPAARAIYLFGSRASGEARPDSDVDVAVLCEGPIDPVARWEAQERIAAKLGGNVDLVDLRRASSVLRVQVLSIGKLLFDGDPGRRALFEATALSDYARLNEERREILEDIRKRGHVHG